MSQPITPQVVANVRILHGNAAADRLAAKAAR